MKNYHYYSFLNSRTSVGTDTVDSSLQLSSSQQKTNNSKVRQRISRVYKSAIRRKFLRRTSKMSETDSVFGDELEDFGGG